MVLFFVFLQPLAIMYFFYWKTRRQYALLDIVVKLYAVGFWFTTFQSVIIEFILEILIVACLYPVLGSGVSAVTQADDTDDSTDTDVTNDGVPGGGQHRLSVSRSLARRAWRLFRLSSTTSTTYDYNANGYGFGYAAAATASDEAAVEAQRKNLRDNFFGSLLGSSL